MTARATIHITPDDDAEAILSALEAWLRRVDGRRIEVGSTWRGFRVVLYGAPHERGTWQGGTRVAGSGGFRHLEDAIAEALNAAKKGDDHAA